MGQEKGGHPDVFRVENLQKRYGEIRAVDGVSFEVREGEIYGLLGPNGAGKTTTISMMSGLLRPDEGRILFDGVDIVAEPIRVKQQLGIVPQETALYEDLSARENLKFWGGIYGISGSDLDQAVERTLEQVGLEARAKDAVTKYSGGMKRRLNLALGLVHRPRAVLLDEPTVGIDPQARANILQVVRGVASSGTTVLYTTHYLEEAETLCDRIGIMDQGKILAEGTLTELKQQAGEEELVIIEGTFEADEVRAKMEQVPHARLVSAEQGKIVLATGGGGKAAVETLSRAFQTGLELDAVSIKPPSLNSLFLNMTGRELRD
jgi:ABC-2 type transport system ATP-binding protein